jgi:hypothetical protein
MLSRRDRRLSDKVGRVVVIRVPTVEILLTVHFASLIAAEIAHQVMWYFSEGCGWRMSVV